MFNWIRKYFWFVKQEKDFEEIVSVFATVREELEDLVQRSKVEIHDLNAQKTMIDLEINDWQSEQTKSKNVIDRYYQ